MMRGECERTAQRLTSFVDGTLPLHERADVERHLDACPPCRAAATQEQGGRTILREQARGLLDAPLPPGLRSRCEALTRGRDARVAPPFIVRRFAPLTAVMALLIAFLTFSLATHRSDTVLAAQLTADHAKCFRLFANRDASAVDAQRVEQMLQDDYGWDLRVPPSSGATGVRLIGARRCLYADGAIPHVMYDVGGHDRSPIWWRSATCRACGSRVAEPMCWSGRWRPRTWPPLRVT